MLWWVVLLTGFLRKAADKDTDQNVCVSVPLTGLKRERGLPALGTIDNPPFQVPFTLKPLWSYMNIRYSLQRYVHTGSAHCSFSRHLLSTLSAQGTPLGPEIRQWARWAGVLPRRFLSCRPLAFVHWVCWGEGVPSIDASKVTAGPKDCCPHLGRARCRACERLVRENGVSSWKMLWTL